MTEGRASTEAYDAARERRRLAVLWVGIITFVVTLLLARGEIVGINSDAVAAASAIAALIASPPLIYWSWRRVNNSFAHVQAAIESPDLEVKDAAISEALALPLRGTLINATAWFVGYVLAYAVGQLIVSYGRTATISFVIDGMVIIPLISFPIYSLIEARLRPPLRILSEQTAASGRAVRAIPNRFDIGRRVLLATGSLMGATIVYANTIAIVNVFGADLSYDRSTEILLMQIPLYVLMLVVVGASVVVSLRGSISELEKAVSSAADGDLRRRAAVTSTDELGALMVDFDRMLANQAKLLKASSNVAGEVTMGANAVADGSEQSTTGIAEIAQAMQEVVAGAETQFAQIDLARGATVELNNAIEAAAEESQQAAHVSASARELADEGAVAAANAREAMERMRATIDSARGAVDQLGGDTANIGTIVETIVSIAAQTNLLALNAAIEAARAGEQGRGFAVVAEEVRQLATESSDAAAEISALIKSIEQTVIATVRAVGDGSEEVSGGTKVVDDAGRTFTDISHSLATIDEHVQSINARTSDVAAATTAVTDAVAEILHVTENVASLAEETSASTEEASASSEEITSSADTLRSMAQDLESQIAVFQV